MTCLLQCSCAASRIADAVGGARMRPLVLSARTTLPRDLADRVNQALANGQPVRRPPLTSRASPRPAAHGTLLTAAAPRAAAAGRPPRHLLHRHLRLRRDPPRRLLGGGGQAAAAAHGAAAAPPRARLLGRGRHVVPPADRRPDGRGRRGPGRVHDAPLGCVRRLERERPRADGRLQPHQRGRLRDAPEGRHRPQDDQRGDVADGLCAPPTPLRLPEAAAAARFTPHLHRHLSRLTTRPPQLWAESPLASTDACKWFDESTQTIRFVDDAKVDGYFTRLGGKLADFSVKMHAKACRCPPPPCPHRLSPSPHHHPRTTAHHPSGPCRCTRRT